MDSSNQHDELYTKVREHVTHGKRLPYAQYLHSRSLYYITNVANEEQLKEIESALQERQPYGTSNS